MFNKIKEKKLTKKRELLQAQEEAKKQHEIEVRSHIKRTLNQMKAQTSKLDVFKKEYIDKARKAALLGNKQTYKLAKSGLKMCLSKQKFLETMVANFEIALQTAEMNNLIGQFVGGINEISTELNAVTSGLDFTKAQIAYDKALQNNESQYEALDAFLSEASDSIESFSGTEDFSDDEIDNLINCQVVDTESDMDSQIEKKLSSIRSKINNSEEDN